MKTRHLIVMVASFILATSWAQANTTEDTFTVQLPCATDLTTLPYAERDLYGDDWYETYCGYEEIQIPSGRPIYALLVSGFHQNKNLDMFHWYNFAEYLQSRGAYVHFAWWNNLLAPYMERPLHDWDSVPSTGPIPWGTILDARLGGDKAIPNDDFQFQQDARALLEAIREHNSEAVIVLVGHSMGGNAVLRLAESMPDGFRIDLLAPIDPVGNRSCIWDPWGNIVSDPWGGLFGPYASCNGEAMFIRWRAIRQDMLDDPRPDPHIWYPPKRTFDGKVHYLYHRWQQEFAPPYDYSCPGHGDDVWWPCASGYYNVEANYLIDHPHNEDRVHSVLEARLTGSTNIQSKVDTDLFSGKDVPVVGSNFGGGADGHGELVGFRGSVIGSAEDDFWAWFKATILEPFKIFEFESYPLALEAEGDWPRWDPDAPDLGTTMQERVAILEAWEKDPSYLYRNGYEPWNPGLCMVSRDLCNILDMIVGPSSLEVLCKDVTVPTDPGVCHADASVDDGSQGSVTLVQEPEGPYGLGDTAVTLTVTDDSGNTSSCSATVTVIDETPPTAWCNAPPTIPEVQFFRPRRFTATAEDNCRVSVRVRDLICTGGDDDACHAIRRRNRVIVLKAEEGSVIEWKVVATDTSRNRSTANCITTVVDDDDGDSDDERSDEPD